MLVSVCVGGAHVHAQWEILNGGSTIEPVIAHLVEHSLYCVLEYTPLN